MWINLLIHTMLEPMIITLYRLNKLHVVPKKRGQIVYNDALLDEAEEAT